MADLRSNVHPSITPAAGDSAINHAAGDSAINHAAVSNMSSFELFDQFKRRMKLGSTTEKTQTRTRRSSDSGMSRLMPSAPIKQSAPWKWSSLPESQHVCTSETCSVDKALATTELLEAILDFLPTNDVLGARRTNRAWEATIQQSPELRLHLFTYGAWSRPASQFQLLPSKLLGLSIERGKEIHLGQWIIITMTPVAARQLSSGTVTRTRSRSIHEGLRGGLGSKHQIPGQWPGETPTTASSEDTLLYEDLFVTQPPLIGMQAHLVRPPKSESEPIPSAELEGPPIDAGSGNAAKLMAKISCNAGIKLAFLADTVQSIVDSAASAPSNIKDATIMFSAIMSFTEPQIGHKERSGRKSVIHLT